MIYKIALFIYLGLVCLTLAFKVAIDPIWLGISAGIAAIALIVER